MGERIRLDSGRLSFGPLFTVESADPILTFLSPTIVLEIAP